MKGKNMKIQAFQDVARFGNLINHQIQAQRDRRYGGSRVSLYILKRQMDKIVILANGPQFLKSVTDRHLNWITKDTQKQGRASSEKER